MKLPAPRDQLAGCMWLARIIAKARGVNAGTLEPEYAARFCHASGVDGQFISFFHLTRENLLTACVGSDEAVATWFTALPSANKERIAEWNRIAPNLGRPGFPMAERLPVALATTYAHLAGSAYGTVFEVLEADEQEPASYEKSQLPTFSIRRLRVGEGQLFKTLRLTALKDAPDAFSTSYESALLRTDESWSEQADRTAGGSDRCMLFAFSGDVAIGKAALYRDETDDEEGELVQVWVASAFRRVGVGRALSDRLCTWARENEFKRVRAGVKRGNDQAVKFYTGLGFAPVETPSASADGDLVFRKAV